MNTKPKAVFTALRGIPLGVWVALGLSAGVALAAELEPRTVTGRLVAPPDCNWTLGETKGLLLEQLPAFPIPPKAKSKGRLAEDEWFQKWKTTAEGQAFLSQPRKKYDLCASNDGSFSIENVVPGEYWLSYSFHDKQENELVSTGRKTFSLSPGATPFSLGEIQMAVRPYLRNG